MKSIHDNICHGFELDGRNSTLILHTTFPDKSTVEETDVVFTGVWAHHLEGVQDGNIIFDIEEVDLATVQTDFHDTFQRLEKHGWPVQTKHNQNLTDLITTGKLKTFRINTSYGMQGFVVAEKLETK